MCVIRTGRHDLEYRNKTFTALDTQNVKFLIIVPHFPPWEFYWSTRRFGSYIHSFFPNPTKQTLKSIPEKETLHYTDTVMFEDKELLTRHAVE